jgi:hypothetical protein
LEVESAEGLLGACAGEILFKKGREVGRVELLDAGKYIREKQGGGAGAGGVE